MGIGPKTFRPGAEPVNQQTCLRDNALSRAERELLRAIYTCDLCGELENRAGVERIEVPAGSEIMFTVRGPMSIFKVAD